MTELQTSTNSKQLQIAKLLRLRNRNLVSKKWQTLWEKEKMLMKFGLERVANIVGKGENADEKSKKA